MKLKNLLFATMFACAFASCSSDDDPVIDNGGGEDPSAEATLEVKVATPAVTKAGETDETISTLSVLVFDEASQRLESKGTNEAGKTEDVQTSVIAKKITAGSKKVLVLANVNVDGYTADIKEGTLYETVLNATKEYNNEVDGQLSMNSQVYTVTLEAGVTNYLGYTEKEANDYKGHYLNQASGATVKLYRNVAKIVLNSVQVTANETKYKNAKLDIESVFVLHANKTTKLVGKDGDAWGTTVISSYNYLNGASQAEYKGVWVEYMRNKDAVQNYIPEGQEEIYNENPNAALISDLSKKDIAYGTTWTPEGNNSFYAYENTSKDIYTLLVVKGKFKYGDITEPESRYYSVAIGKDGGLEDGYGKPQNIPDSREEKLFGTVRNIQYNVDLRVAGPGYTTPFGPKAEDDTFLDVQVEVVAFGFVNQKVDIE